MKKAEFLKIWPEMKDKPVRIVYGYQDPKPYGPLTFVDYKELTRETWNNRKCADIYLRTDGGGGSFTVRALRSVKILEEGKQ